MAEALQQEVVDGPEKQVRRWLASWCATGQVEDRRVGDDALGQLAVEGRLEARQEERKVAANLLSPLEPVDEPLGELAEDVVMGDTATLLRLDPLRPESVPASPLLEAGPQADHMQKGPVHPHPARRFSRPPRAEEFPPMSFQ